MSLNILFNKSDKNPLSTLVFIELVSVTKYPDIKTFQKVEPDNYSAWLAGRDKTIELFNGNISDEYTYRSCFNPLYSKIVGAAIGAFGPDDSIKVKKIASDDEKTVLGVLSSAFFNAYDKEKILAAHNLSGYHIPFYTKRLLASENANKIVTKDAKGQSVIVSVPAIIREHLMAKPWETKTVDTMQLIKFGSYNNTSLTQACHFFGIDAPKVDKIEASALYYGSGANGVELMGNIAQDYVEGTMNMYKLLRETV